MISDKMRFGACSRVEGEKGQSPNSLVKEKLAMLTAQITSTYKILIDHQRQEVDKERREKRII